MARGIAWGAGFAVGNALWGGTNWGRGDVDINVNRYNNINVNNRIEGGGNRSNWSHNTDHRKTSYRGGEGQRQNLQNKAASTNRQQYRGKEGGAGRDASRAQAQQAMQKRGVDPAPSGSAASARRASTAARSIAPRRSSARRTWTAARRSSGRRTWTAARRSSGRRTWTAARRSNAPNRPRATTRCVVPTARRHVRSRPGAHRAMHPHSVRQAVERVPPATAVAAAGVLARVREAAAAAEVRALVAVAAVDAVVAAVDVVDNGSAWT